ncbi:MAG: DUF1552 domain-containing protein [Proteobacteria bacterium]|nr:DUF1552 domain-containing protein [Pseudomonadota bacterium]
MTQTTNRLNRRAFLAGMGGLALGSAALGSKYLIRPAGAETDRPPTRLLIIHKPCGTVPENYHCTGGERDFTLSPILEPFAPLRPHMVVVEGLRIAKRERTPGQDHGNGMVTFMTGGVTIKARGFRTVTADRESIDHILATDRGVGGNTPIRSLHLAADVRSDRDELFTRVLSYSGRASPVPPETRPVAAYTRVFGGLFSDGVDRATLEHVERARSRRKSILDFSRTGVERLYNRVGAAERIRLDAHVDAIRETERLIDNSLSCAGAADLTQLRREVDVEQIDDLHGEFGLAHLNIIRTAFQCDLTRIATFAWGPGNSPINFSRLIPGVENMGYHTITHSGSNRAHDETAIHRWYNERMAEFLITLRDTPDFDGSSLLDNTLVVVWSEVRLGSPHTFDNIPIQLFGHAGLQLGGGRLLRFAGRSTNDLWLTIANALGHPMECFGDAQRCKGPLAGLFD